MTRDERAVDALDASESAFGESASRRPYEGDAPAEKNPEKRNVRRVSSRDGNRGQADGATWLEAHACILFAYVRERLQHHGQKIKALELNQSMFDRYVEASIARVAERLDDVSADVEAAEEIAANATAASLRAEAKALNAAKDTSQLEEASKTARVSFSKNRKRARTRSNTKLAALEREMSRVTPPARAALGATLLATTPRRPLPRFSTPPRRSLRFC